VASLQEHLVRGGTVSETKVIPGQSRSFVLRGGDAQVTPPRVCPKCSRSAKTKCRLFVLRGRLFVVSLPSSQLLMVLLCSCCADVAAVAVVAAATALAVTYHFVCSRADFDPCCRTFLESRRWRKAAPAYPPVCDLYALVSLSYRRPFASVVSSPQAVKEARAQLLGWIGTHVHANSGNWEVGRWVCLDSGNHTHRHTLGASSGCVLLIARHGIT